MLSSGSKPRILVRVTRELLARGRRDALAIVAVGEAVLVVVDAVVAHLADDLLHAAEGDGDRPLGARLEGLDDDVVRAGLQIGDE